MSTLRILPSASAAMLALLMGLGAASPLQAQSLVEMYRSARFRVQASSILETNGRRAVPMESASLPYVTDSVRRRIERFFPPETPPSVEVRPPIRVTESRLVPKLARGWFEEKFPHIRWSYLGSNGTTALDTTFTRELRARLQAQFGAPTFTMADYDSETSERENIQFEYWFVLNDSIPLVVMDVNGPFERGVVVATDSRYREMLPELRNEFLSQIVESRRRAPYVDYYYLPEQTMWFRTGYFGGRFFLDRIPKPDLKLGRPLLESVRGR